MLTLQQCIYPHAYFLCRLIFVCYFLFLSATTMPVEKSDVGRFIEAQLKPLWEDFLLANPDVIYTSADKATCLPLHHNLYQPVLDYLGDTGTEFALPLFTKEQQKENGQKCKLYQAIKRALKRYFIALHYLMQITFDMK